MAITKFQEYLSQTGRLETSGKVKKIADYEGKIDHKPAKENKHKDSGGKGQVGEAKPYKNGTDAKDPNKGKMTDGFANKGDKSLVYQPKTDVPAKSGEKATWPKTKMQEWVDKTKTMSLAAFTKNMSDSAFKGLDECACQDAPHNSIKDTVSICKCNEQYISSLVREMKRNGMFGKMLEEMLKHPETYNDLKKIMENNDSCIRKLANTLNEMISPPVGMDAPTFKKKRPPMGDMAMDGGEENLEDEELPDEEMDPSEESPEDEEDFGSEDELDGEEEMGSSEEDDFDSENSEPDPEEMPPKKGNIEQMLKHMKNKPTGF